MELYDSIVWSTISYVEKIWGGRDFGCIYAVQNKAIQFNMGVGRYTPNVAVEAVSGRKPSSVRQWQTVISFWNRMKNLSSDRLSKRIHNWTERCFRQSKVYMCKNSNFNEINSLNFAPLRNCITKLTFTNHTSLNRK